MSRIEIRDGNIESNKRYLFKISDGDGNYIGSSDKFSFRGYRKILDGGVGSLKVDLAEPFESFGEGTLIDHMNDVEVVVSDKESGASGTVIYKGFISDYFPTDVAGRSGVQVVMLGYASRLADILYFNSTTKTVSFTKNSTDPSQMIKDIIDRYRAEETRSTKINYTGSSIVNTTTSPSYTFVMQYCREAIETAREMSPNGWHWYVDETNTISFSGKPTTATHHFVSQKNIQEINITKSTQHIKNSALLWDGSTTTVRKTDAASVAAYGLRMERRTDTRWNNQSTMTSVANAFIDGRKDPQVLVSFDVLDSNQNPLGYDIETINPGDTFTLTNLPASSTGLLDNTRIYEVMYTPHKAMVIGGVKPTTDLTKRLVDIQSDLNDRSYQNGPTSYTDV